MTSVAIVEDNDNLRRTLNRWVDAASDCRCTCACATAEEALVAIPEQRPDVVLMDIRLPGASGIACTARLKEQLPQLQVIILTLYKDHDLIFEALKAGACGYLLKRASRPDILRAIAEVRAGGAPMTGEIARRVVEVFRQPSPPATPSVKVSPREQEVLDLLSQGMSNKQIAERLGISYETVCVHLRHTYEKLHVRSRTEAVIRNLQTQSQAGAGLCLAASQTHAVNT